ncbi:MAG: 5'-nucleotidase C-terminal domain-containing protein [Proteobacteria bacterium]|nr:5'-nucleotidase C-terminal domain-containing protein [Pseudomonadota bacterium]
MSLVAATIFRYTKLRTVEGIEMALQKMIGFGIVMALAANVTAASLTLFHNNDGESKLEGDANFGSAASFAATLDALRAANAGRDLLTISSGDNFLAGAAFNASVASGPIGERTYFDALVLAEIGYDAITVGNHEFDFGPDVLADFINFYQSHGGMAPFLSSNLDFSGNANLQRLVNAGTIAKSTIVTRGSEQYGIIGATTQMLGIVSSPGTVTAGDVVDAIQSEVTKLQNQGVNKIILSSHLQNLNNEIDLVGRLKGIDIVIAGGGDELLINIDNARNTVSQAYGAYPRTVLDADRKNVAVVTTVGEYLYVGQLNVEFDSNGEVTNVSGEPVVVDKHALNPAASVKTNISAPLAAATAVANNTQIATTDVFLERSGGDTNGPHVIRARETNLGNLIADAFVWAVANEATGLTDGNTLIALQNGGGIREDLDNDENGIITQGEAQATLPFTNTLAVIQNVDPAGLALVLENAVAALPHQSGSFGHVSGIKFDYNPNATVGHRIIEIRRADGTVVWHKGTGAQFAGKFDIATNSFLASAGTPDGYDFNAYGKVILSTGYADALIGFLTTKLGGSVGGVSYAVTGDNRINAVPMPVGASAP